MTGMTAAAVSLTLTAVWSAADKKGNFLKKGVPKKWELLF
jgi:hypothetical protein